MSYVGQFTRKVLEPQAPRKNKEERTISTWIGRIREESQKKGD